MAKNVKKNKRRASSLRLRGMFLGIESADTMAVKRLTHHIHAVIGTQKFSSYVTACNRVSEWEDFKSKYESTDHRIKRHSRGAETDIEVDRKEHLSRRATGSETLEPEVATT